jgi:hypothetical protein
MKEGYLSEYFVAVASKRLSAVETDKKRSNQHEYNGSQPMKAMFGPVTGEKQKFDANFIWFGKENEALSSEGFVTWYDSRWDHPTRSEPRLYFNSTVVSEMAQAGDMLFIAKRPDNTVMVIITAAGSTIESQISWLFGLGTQNTSFTFQNISDGDDREIDFAVRFIFDELGIEIEEPETEYLDFLLKRYDSIFPTTVEFSLHARNTFRGKVNAVEEPDKTLMAWMDHEEKMFRRLERKIIEERIRSGFMSANGTDVDGFISFSLGVQNRRKSRAGLALENHLEQVLGENRILYSRTARTEKKSKPDFLFPSHTAYHNSEFPPSLLTMLGVKTSCKDRWRQVLPEAAKIENKHLFTLEPGISENQTDEMQAHKLQLVLPASIHETYRDTQRTWLMNLADFISMVAERQSDGYKRGLLP